MILESLERQGERVRAELPLLEKLREAVGFGTDLNPPQYLSWLAVCLDFRPDLVIELGREYGNSTALFSLAANRIGDTRVHSFCFSEVWQYRTRPRLETVAGPGFFGVTTAHTGDLTQVDFAPLVAGRERVLILLDAHGFEVAEHLLAHLLPLVADRPHLVLCHDISDNRFIDDSQRSYGGRRFWRGMDDWYENQGTTAYANLGWVSSIVDQVIPILDFCQRNRIELRSADWEFQESSRRDPALLARAQRALPELLPDTRFHYAWFTLNEGRAPFHFPAAVPARRRLGPQLRDLLFRFGPLRRGWAAARRAAKRVQLRLR